MILLLPAFEKNELLKWQSVGYLNCDRNSCISLKFCHPLKNMHCLKDERWKIVRVQQAFMHIKNKSGSMQIFTNETCPDFQTVYCSFKQWSFNNIRNPKVTKSLHENSSEKQRAIQYCNHECCRALDTTEKADKIELTATMCSTLPNSSEILLQKNTLNLCISDTLTAMWINTFHKPFLKN